MNWADYAKNYFKKGEETGWKMTDYYIPSDITEEEAEEKDLRQNHAAVKDAWEKYQTVLRLARK